MSFEQGPKPRHGLDDWMALEMPDASAGLEHLGSLEEYMEGLNEEIVALERMVGAPTAPTMDQFVEQLRQELSQQDWTGLGGR